jgi:hypothetical protein
MCCTYLKENSLWLYRNHNELPACGAANGRPKHPDHAECYFREIFWKPILTKGRTKCSFVCGYLWVTMKFMFVYTK